MKQDDETLAAVIESTLQLGAFDGDSPSDAVLSRLRTLAKAGDLPAMSETYDRFARANPRNATFVVARIPAMIVSEYLPARAQMTFQEATAWFKGNADWAERLKDDIRSPQSLVASVNQILKGILAARAGSGIPCPRHQPCR